MEKEIEKVDPGKKVDVGTYRLDHKGNQAQRKVGNIFFIYLWKLKLGRSLQKIYLDLTIFSLGDLLSMNNKLMH